MPKIKEVVECQGNLRALAPILVVLSLLMIGTARSTRAWLIKTITSTKEILTLTRDTEGLGNESGTGMLKPTPSVKSVKNTEG